MQEGVLVNNAIYELNNLRHIFPHEFGVDGQDFVPPVAVASIVRITLRVIRSKCWEGGGWMVHGY